MTKGKGYEINVFKLKKGSQWVEAKPSAYSENLIVAKAIGCGYNDSNATPFIVSDSHDYSQGGKQGKNTLTMETYRA